MIGMDTAVMFQRAQTPGKHRRRCSRRSTTSFGSRWTSPPMRPPPSVPGGSVLAGSSRTGCRARGPLALRPGRAGVTRRTSRDLQPKFIAHAARERWRGVTTVLLLPARTDTKAFHHIIWNAETHRPRATVEVRFLPVRLRFVGAPAGAPFPSMIVVFSALDEALAEPWGLGK